MKKYIISIGIFVCFFGSLALFTFFAESDAREIRNGVLRFHIVANSDSESDQQYKMTVRDGVAELCSQLFYNAVSKEEAITQVLDNSELIENEANSILRGAGCGDTVSVCVRKRFFPTRFYEGVSLPAGVYDTVDITIGEGQGKNFWCVMFPDICIGASSEVSNERKMSDILEGDSLEMATSSDSGRIRLKFKAVEIFENFINFFRAG